ncbi:MAG: hypothetical protein LBS61_00120 [Endomicrobium sp.]|jgi:hypothetical protein|nr:hypothetical protein [Endomicrobium sp.]
MTSDKLSTIVDNYKNDCWQIWYFKDITHKEPIKPHYYVVIPLIETTSLLACLITSQIEKREQFYSDNPNPPLKEYLIRTNQKELSCLTKDRLIDCNNPLLYIKTNSKNAWKV